MVVGGDSYAHDLITLCGGENVFASASRRYPRVELAEIEAALVARQVSGEIRRQRALVTERIHGQGQRLGIRGDGANGGDGGLRIGLWGRNGDGIR